jgi:hypothetical protein
VLITRRNFTKYGLLFIGLDLVMGCTSLPKPISLSINEQRRLETIDHFVQTFFTQEARNYLKHSPLYVVKHGPSDALNGDVPSGTYFNFKRHVDKIAYERARNVEDIIFHESIHYLDDVGLIDRDKFMKAYNKMKDAPPKVPSQRINKEIFNMKKNEDLSLSSVYGIITEVTQEIYHEQDYYPIKKLVDIIVASYNPKQSDLVAERIAYTVGLWKLDGYEIPEELKEVFDGIIIKHNGGSVELVKS